MIDLIKMKCYFIITLASMHNIAINADEIERTWDKHKYINIYAYIWASLLSFHFILV